MEKETNEEKGLVPQDNSVAELFDLVLTNKNEKK